MTYWVSEATFLQIITKPVQNFKTYFDNSFSGLNVWDLIDESCPKVQKRKGLDTAGERVGFLMGMLGSLFEHGFWK
ncbi:hypothetical protein GLOIN_2v1838335 [Rhizophagus irregularis DAOM 181602=DAOM 197198]|nr:hypothetical protein GLOIN_2v1838335 [Rhizophagus irregularis DAOM 181602=DAOM 197198]